MVISYYKYYLIILHDLFRVPSFQNSSTQSKFIYISKKNIKKSKFSDKTSNASADKKKQESIIQDIRRKKLGDF
jgi:hypothetical protein